MAWEEAPLERFQPSQVEVPEVTECSPRDGGPEAPRLGQGEGRPVAEDERQTYPWRRDAPEAEAQRIAGMHRCRASGETLGSGWRTAAGLQRFDLEFAKSNRRLRQTPIVQQEAERRDSAASFKLTNALVCYLLCRSGNH